MRAFLTSVAFTLVATGLSALPLACTQDAAASNEERDTHMGNIRAVAPESTGKGLPDGPPAAQPGATTAPQAPSAAGVAAPPASPAISASATQPAPQAPSIQKKP